MLEVHVNVNRKIDIATLHAVRTKPKGCKIKPGTVCKYNVMYGTTTVDIIEGPYGCGVDLAIQLLELWKKNANLYKTLSLYKVIEEEGKK